MLEPLTQKEVDTIADMFPALEVKYNEEQWKDAAKEWWMLKYKLRVEKMKK